MTLSSESVDSPELDAEIVPIVEEFDSSMGVPGLSVDELRNRYRALLAGQVQIAEPVSTSDVAIPTRHGEIPARLYRPDAEHGAPLLVYMHGGGFMVGDLDSVDPALHFLSREAGVSVLSLDYALAPEHRYPVALEQCEDALSWAARNLHVLGAAPRLGVAGDSAGGNLAALLSLRARQLGIQNLAWQALINPVLDFPAVEETATLSHRQFAEGPVLSAEIMKAFIAAYFPDDGSKLVASPLHVSNIPPDLAPAFVAAAECDPLRDDAVAYADRLQVADIDVELHVYRGMCHNFITMAGRSGTALSMLRDLAASARRNLH